MKTIIIIVATTILAVGSAVFLVMNQPKCVQSHTEKRWKEAYTSRPFIGSSNMALRMHTVRHPAQWVDVTICDKYEEKAK